MQLVFFGGGSFAATVLQRLSDACEVRLVITPPAAGRKTKLTLPPAAQMAQKLQLPLTHRITAGELQQTATTTIVCDYGKILSPPLLAAAGSALNIHPSLLPRWRGAAPIERALLAGDASTGVTIMQMNERLDSGDIVAQWQTPLGNATTAAELYALLAEQGAALLLQVLAAPPRTPPQPQDEAQATYADKIFTADRQLDFNQSAELCQRRVRAFTPKPGAHFYIGDERLRVLAAEVQPLAQPAAAGTLLAADSKRNIIIACGGGEALVVTRLQRAGRNAMPVADFLRGLPLDEYLGRQVGTVPPLDG